MALKRPAWKPGTLVLLEHDSKILRNNALRDPHVRDRAAVVARAVVRVAGNAVAQRPPGADAPDSLPGVSSTPESPALPALQKRMS